MAKNVAPRGFPRCFRLSACFPSSAREVLSRKSCVIAIPIDANANDVRSHARNVRSARSATPVLVSKRQEARERGDTLVVYLARGGREPRSLCSRARCCGNIVDSWPIPSVCGATHDRGSDPMSSCFGRPIVSEASCSCVLGLGTVCLAAALAVSSPPPTHLRLLPRGYPAPVNVGKCKNRRLRVTRRAVAAASGCRCRTATD
jgi:hypothetical protein